jgi:hypothetical protein
MPIDQNAETSWRNPAQVNNARSFLLMAAGVLTGLISPAIRSSPRAARRR